MYARMLFFSTTRQVMFSGHQLPHFPVKLGMGGKIFPGLPNSTQTFPQVWDQTCVVSLSSLTGSHHGAEGCCNIFVLSFLKGFAAKRARTAWTCSFYKAACLPVAFHVQVSQTKASLRCGTPQASFDVLVITFFWVLLNGSRVAHCSPSDSGDVKLSDGKRVRHSSVKVLCKHNL